MSEQKSPSEAVEVWEQLINSEGWKWLVESIRGQMEARQQKVLLQPLVNADGVFEQEFSKGEFQAFALVLQLPSLAVESLKADIAEINQENQQ